MGVGVNAAEFEHWVTERDKKALEKVGGVERVAEAVGSDLKKGLCADAWNSAERKESYGVNEFEYPPPKSFLELCNDALADVTVRILIAASIVSLAIGAGMKKHRDEYGYLEGIAIVIVVIVVVFLQAGIDYAKEMKFRQLNSIKDNYQVKVVRDGRSVAVHAGEIMVGDLVELAAGDKVPADGLFVEGSKFKANEAAMTGEPIDIAKSREKGPLGSLRDLHLGGFREDARHRRRLALSVGRHSQDSHRRTERYASSRATRASRVAHR